MAMIMIKITTISSTDIDVIKTVFIFIFFMKKF